MRVRHQRLCRMVLPLYMCVFHSSSNCLLSSRAMWPCLSLPASPMEMLWQPERSLWLSDSVGPLWCLSVSKMEAKCRSTFCGLQMKPIIGNSEWKPILYISNLEPYSMWYRWMLVSFLWRAQRSIKVTSQPKYLLWFFNLLSIGLPCWLLLYKTVTPNLPKNS